MTIKVLNLKQEQAVGCKDWTSIDLMKRKKRKKKYSIHKQMIDDLFERHIGKPGIECVVKELEYWNQHDCIGETDLLIRYEKGYEVYIEVKCNDQPKLVDKGIDQLLRWSSYHYHGNPTRNYYGILIAGDHVRLVCKNGILRNGLKHIY